MMVILRVIRKFAKILNMHQKIRAIELFLLMVVSGFLEMLSVSLILPFVEAVLNPDTITSNIFIVRICEWFSIDGYISFITFWAVAMAVLYVVKNVFLLIQMTIQNKYIYNNCFLTQQKMLKSIHSRPYTFFLQAKSGDILRMVADDTTQAFGILSHLMTFLSETIVSLALMVSVMIISPMLTIGLALVLLFLVSIIQFLIKPVLKKAGANRVKSLAEMNQWLLQSVQGVKEIKIAQREQYFQNRFAKVGKAYVKSVYQQTTLNSVPKYVLEAVVMGGFLVGIAMFLTGNNDISVIAPVVSGIAMAAIRMLPAMSRISGSLAGITFGEVCVDKLMENVAVLDRENDDLSAFCNTSDTKTPLIFSQCVELSDVGFTYPSAGDKVLNKVNMHINKGESVGVIGVSGAGKTTLIDIILGLLVPQEGKVLVDGEDIHKNIGSWVEQIGYIPQTIFMMDGTIRENVVFGCEINENDDTEVWAALKEASLDEFVKNLPEGLETEVGESGIRLSGGQKQRLGIARALYRKPEILIFDEATSALDNETEASIMEAINSLYGVRTMIIIAHRLSTIENCDVVYRVENGQVKKVGGKKYESCGTNSCETGV